MKFCVYCVAKKGCFLILLLVALLMSGCGMQKPDFSSDDAKELLVVLDEIQMREEEGLVLASTGKTIIIRGSFSHVIAMGQYDEGRFQAEYYYAASEEGGRYYYDPEGDAWLELGFG